MTPQEMIKVFREDGTDTGTILSREEIHEKGEWHQVVHIWVVNDEKQVLVQKRSPHKKMYPGVKHASAAGHIEADESMEEALIKETGEELGIETTGDSFIYIGQFRDQQDFPDKNLHDREIINIFLLPVNADGVNLRLQQSEVDSTEWIGIEEFERQINDEELFKQYLNHPKEYYQMVIGGIRKNFAT